MTFVLTIDPSGSTLRSTSISCTLDLFLFFFLKKKKRALHSKCVRKVCASHRHLSLSIWVASFGCCVRDIEPDCIITSKALVLVSINPAHHWVVSVVFGRAGLGRVVVGWLGRTVDGPRSRRSSRYNVQSEEEENLENGSGAEAHAASLAVTRRPLPLPSSTQWPSLLACRMQEQRYTRKAKEQIQRATAAPKGTTMTVRAAAEKG